MAIEKRYQVFISSTFRDLVEERQVVLKAVLELNHMPAGMELFPASDDSAWQLIKDVIDNSDYYVLIIGGCYGSQDETGIGYTEKEYDYAAKMKKPIIPLLHKNPDNLPREKTDTDEIIWEKLQAFRKKIERNHTCDYWSSPDDLKTKVIVGLTSTTKRHPKIGWIRADQVPSGATVVDILTLRERVNELETELEQIRTEPPPGTEDLLQGEDNFSISCQFSARFPNDYLNQKKYSGTIIATWNQIFSGIAPALINESTDSNLKKKFFMHFSQLCKEAFKDTKEVKDKELVDFSFDYHDFDTCIIQFRALGLIRESNRKRSIKDTATYWCLTLYGDRLMVQLRALKKKPAEIKRSSGMVEETPDEDTSPQ